MLDNEPEALATEGYPSLTLPARCSPLSASGLRGKGIRGVRYQPNPCASRWS
jgi:hypothetical protein